MYSLDRSALYETFIHIHIVSGIIQRPSLELTSGCVAADPSTALRRASASNFWSHGSPKSRTGQRDSDQWR